MSGATVTFWVFALLAVAGALVVVRSHDPFTSVLALIVNFGALGGLYLTLESPFVAIAQLLVYATAVVVLFLFVFAYLGDRRVLPRSGESASAGAPLLGIGLGAAFIGLVTWATLDDRSGLEPFPGRDALLDSFGSTFAIAETFLTDYILQFEATALVLLVAVIGGISLGLTGRARHDRLRRELRARSADQHRQRVLRDAAQLPDPSEGGRPGPASGGGS